MLIGFLSNSRVLCTSRSFFFNDTATTENYTYWHTLSLHDALPIYREILTVRPASPPFPNGVCAHPKDPAEAKSSLGHWYRAAMPPPYDQEKRSEEHTSELQSLMRISYAVYCLKKKITGKPKMRETQS